MTPICFISGHLDLTEIEFITHYIEPICTAAEAGASFVVGDAKGCDLMAQALLDNMPIHNGKAQRPHVTVFHMFESPRHNGGRFPTCGGFETDDERDAAMTAASTEDIAWVRPGRAKSGTAKNLDRRTDGTAKA